MANTRPHHEQPLRRVVSVTHGPKCQTVVLPDGSTAIVCGPRPRIETLECGHQVTVRGRKAARRVCDQCPATDGQLPLGAT